MKIETSPAYQAVMRDLLKMRDWWKRTHAFGGATQPKELYQITDLVKVGNDTADALSRGDVLEIDGTRLLSVANLDSTRPPWLVGVKPTKGNVLIAVLLEPCRAKVDDKRTIVPAQMSGVCVVNVNVTATWHRRAYPVKDSYVLTSGLFGPVEILSEPDGTGEQLLACSIGHSDNRGVFAEVQSGGISAGSYRKGKLRLGSGTVRLVDATNVLATYQEQAKQITAYNAECEGFAGGEIIELHPSDDWLPLAEFLCDPGSESSSDSSSSDSSLSDSSESSSDSSFSDSSDSSGPQSDSLDSSDSSESGDILSDSSDSIPDGTCETGTYCWFTALEENWALCAGNEPFVGPYWIPHYENCPGAATSNPPCKCSYPTRCPQFAGDIAYTPCDTR